MSPKSSRKSSVKLQRNKPVRHSSSKPSLKKIKSPKKPKHAEQTVDKNNSTVKIAVRKTDEKKLLRKDREKVKNPEKYDLAEKVKKIWFDLRRNDLPKDHRRELAEQLLIAVKGNAAKLASAHDTSRFLQTFLKYGSAHQKNEIFEEMKPSFVAMMTQKYAMHYLLKVLEYGSNGHRQFITDCVIGNGLRLLKNVYSAKVVDEIYTKYAKPVDKKKMLVDLYGSTFRRLKTDRTETFHSVYEQADQETKDRLISSAKHVLVFLASLGNGRAAQLSIVHGALDEFLHTCPTENAMRHEVLEAWKDNLHGLLSTKVGGRCAQHFIWEFNAKDRKVLIKSLKPIIARLCADAEATPFLISIFDTVDDVVLVNKCIVKYLLGKYGNTADMEDESNFAYFPGGLEEIFSTPVTRRLLLYIISPRDPLHFSPIFIEKLTSPVLPSGLPLHTKKSFNERLSDLRRISKVDEILLTYLASNISNLILQLDNDGFLALITMLNKFDTCNGLRTKTFKIFAGLIDPDKPICNIMSVESSGFSIALKRLISGDKKRMEKGAAVEDLFSWAFVNMLAQCPKDIVPRYISTNRGCYLLLALLESEIPEVTNMAKDLLIEYLPLLEKQTFSGALLIVERFL